MANITRTAWVTSAYATTHSTQALSILIERGDFAIFWKAHNGKHVHREFHSGVFHACHHLIWTEDPIVIFASSILEIPPMSAVLSGMAMSPSSSSPCCRVHATLPLSLRTISLVSRIHAIVLSPSVMEGGHFCWPFLAKIPFFHLVRVLASSRDAGNLLLILGFVCEIQQCHKAYWRTRAMFVWPVSRYRRQVWGARTKVPSTCDVFSNSLSLKAP